MKRCRCCRQSWPEEFFTVCRPDGLRRSTCNACRKNCGKPGTAAAKARHQRANIRAGRVQHRICYACGQAFQRPMALGAPPRYCPDCRMARHAVPKANRPSIVLRRIVLGPVPCQGCRQAVTWNGYAWEDAAGNRHSCDNAQAGISGAITDIMCDALSVADTSREGVPRLEVSAPMTFDVR